MSKNPGTFRIKPAKDTENVVHLDSSECKKGGYTGPTKCTEVLKDPSTSSPPYRMDPRPVLGSLAYQSMGHPSCRLLNVGRRCGFPSGTGRHHRHLIASVLRRPDREPNAERERMAIGAVSHGRSTRGIGWFSFQNL
jgi:hypothetical protein